MSTVKHHAADQSIYSNPNRSVSTAAPFPTKTRLGTSRAAIHGRRRRQLHHPSSSACSSSGEDLHRRRLLRLLPQRLRPLPPPMRPPPHRARRPRRRQVLLHRRLRRPPRQLLLLLLPRPPLLRTGVGVAIFANKFPSVYASVCSSVADVVNTRSINDCNVLCLSGFSTPPPLAAQIIDAFLLTPFNSPCPASGDAPWSDDLSAFLANSVPEMKQIPYGGCAICCARKGLRFDPVDIMPGAEMKIVRESPTSAIVRFAAGSVEPAHHHTFGHDVLVMKGRKKVWNFDKKEAYELNEGDYLYTPAGDVHRVKYFEDTEFFIRWDGDWDIFLDEDVEAAKVAIEKELSGNE